MHSDTHKIPGKLQNTSDKACCIKISYECCCSRKTHCFTLCLFISMRETVTLSKEKGEKVTTGSKKQTKPNQPAKQNPKIFSVLCLPKILGKKTQHIHHTALKSGFLSHRLVLANQKKKVLRGKKGFQKAEYKLAIKGTNLRHPADLHHVHQPHGTAAQDIMSQIGADDLRMGTPEHSATFIVKTAAAFTAQSTRRGPSSRSPLVLNAEMYSHSSY